jgi:hypothetical protein
MIYKCYRSVNTYHLAAESSTDAYETCTAASDHRVFSLKLPGRSANPLHAGRLLTATSQSVQQTKQYAMDGLGSVAKAVYVTRQGMVELGRELRFKVLPAGKKPVGTWSDSADSRGLISSEPWNEGSMLQYNESICHLQDFHCYQNAVVLIDFIQGSGKIYFALWELCSRSRYFDYQKHLIVQTGLRCKDYYLVDNDLGTVVYRWKPAAEKAVFRLHCHRV